MTQVTIAAAPACSTQMVRSPWRFLSCIRSGEVIALQGAPLIGAILAIGAPTFRVVPALAAFITASVCLVAHVYVLNDWAGIEDDLNDSKRAAQTFVARGLNRTEVGFLAAGLLAVSLVIFGLLGTAPLVLALMTASLSALYSAPVLHAKSLPVVSSAVHLVGGSLHFLLGYAAFAAIDTRGIVVGFFFALVFTAGHLVQEVQDFEADLRNGIRTNAVVFGKTQSFLAGLALFTAGYALLIAFAVDGIVPGVLVLAAALYPIHLWMSLRALRSGLEFDGLRQLRRGYRLIFAVIGLMMVLAVLLHAYGVAV